MIVKQANTTRRTEAAALLYAAYRGQMNSAFLSLLAASSFGLALPQVLRRLIDAALTQH